MSKANPTGHPLSGQPFETEDGQVVVQYRPNEGGRRRTVRVPVEVAELLQSAQERETARRQALTEDGPRPRKRRAKKAAKRKAAKKRTAKKAAKKRTTRRTSTARKVQAVAEKAADVAAAAAGPAQRELFSNPGRGAPSLRQLGTCAELGRVVELQVRASDGVTRAYKFKGARPRLLWSPKQRALVWVMRAQPSNRKKGAVRTDGAARLFESWAKRGAVQTSTLAVPDVKLATLGHAVTIYYDSDKWGARGGKKTRYVHEFSPSVKAYRNGQNGRVFAVRGGRLTVNERGIVY